MHLVGATSVKFSPSNLNVIAVSLHRKICHTLHMKMNLQTACLPWGKKIRLAVAETKHDSFFRKLKGIARTAVKWEWHCLLSNHFASINFTCLKVYRSDSFRVSGEIRNVRRLIVHRCSTLYLVWKYLIIMKSAEIPKFTIQSCATTHVHRCVIVEGKLKSIGPSLNVTLVKSNYIT